MLKYKQPIEIVDQYLAKHRSYLDECYKNNVFVASGPQNPRTGGIIISQLKDRSQLESVLKNDPFQRYDIADFSIIEFDPVKYHPGFSIFI